MPATIDFNTFSSALVLYYEQRDSLFATAVLAEKYGEAHEAIRSAILQKTNRSPEQLVRALDPANIRRVISKTAKIIRDNSPAGPDVRIMPMLAGEWENGGTNLSISYHFAATPFGPVLIASTPRGVCYLAFSDEGDNKALDKLKARFPKAAYLKVGDALQQQALSLFDHMTDRSLRIHLHLKGTPFQISVWNKLLAIPVGGLMSYSGLTDDPRNSHALGAAVGSNPVAFIIPCHRAVRASGEFGDYHWGCNRKAALICLESSVQNHF